jgi:hypothetical protein
MNCIGHKHKQDDTIITKEKTVLAPILYGRLCTGLEHPNPIMVNILLDLGVSASIININT